MNGLGIARDAKYMSLAESSTLWLYLPLAQNPSTNLTLSLAARVSGNPAALRPAIEREVKTLVPTWPVFQFHSLDEGLELQRRLPRVGAAVLGALGFFGLFLAAIGIYGVMAYVVRQRTRELGIRLALGAPAHHVLGLVIRQGMAVCLVGTAIGFVAAFGADVLLRSLVFGVAAGDPLIYSVVLLILLGTALLACYLPSRHVLRTSVLEVLRCE